MRQVVRRIGVLSAGKIAGIIYGSIGLVIGALFSLVSVFGAVIGSIAAESSEPLLGLFFGIGAVFFFPLFYGMMGFLGGLLMAAVYNFATRFVGGLEVELE